MKFSVESFILLLTAVSVSSASRVFELSDKFMEISHEGMWFVKFYAPWCAHCRRLEPIWAHVAQSLYNTPIKVAKVDCTRFPAFASLYKIRGYPTILFIKGNNHHEYVGDRQKDDMVNYAMRMSQPAVQRISQSDSIAYLKATHPVFFGFVGKQQGHLWETFTLNAEKYQPHSWFYAMAPEVIHHEVKLPNETAVFVLKDDEVFFFEVNKEVLEDRDTLNSTLDKWINAERFGFFPKITSANINNLMDTEKYIVIAVVSENKLNEISQTERDFKDMVEGIIRKRKRELHHRFQFGWLGTPELANSIAMSELTVPNLLVLNSTTNHHHIPDDDPVLMTPEAVSLFLDQIHLQLAPGLFASYKICEALKLAKTCSKRFTGFLTMIRLLTVSFIHEAKNSKACATYGGNHWVVRFYRGFFEARSMLSNMWRGNPVLTALVFGLPLGFLSLICYSICCADILDADEEETPETHEKKD